MVTQSPSVLLFTGSERYLKEEALNKYKSSLLGDPGSGAECKVFRCQDVRLAEMLDDISTFPLFSTKKLIIIKAIEKLSRDDRSRLIASLAKISSAIFVIIDTEDEALVKEFSGLAYVKTLHFDPPVGQKLISWMEEFVSSRGKKIDIASCELLGESTGRDLLAQKQELEKLVAYIGDRERIEISDVERLTGKGAIASAFDLAWAVGAKDLAEALRISGELALEGKKPYETIGLLAWHLQKMTRAKALEARGESPMAIARALRIPRRYQEQFFAELRKLAPGMAEVRIRILLEADLDIKRSRLNSHLILELAILRLCLA